MFKEDYTDRHTFVICAYGESPYLEKCIQSLKEQTVKSNILMTTSTDNGCIRNLAQKYDISLFVSEREPDLAGDWNFAYSHAHTDYITLAHQDDIYAPEYAQTAIQTISSCERPLLFFSDYYELREDKKVVINTNLLIKKILLVPMRFSTLRRNRLFKKAILAFGNPICCPSVTFVRKNLPYVMFKKGMKSNIDWDAWLTAAKMRGEFVYCPAALMGHRIHRDSTTTKIIENAGRTAEDLEMFRKIWPSPVAGVINRVYQNAEQSNSR